MLYSCMDIWLAIPNHYLAIRPIARTVKTAREGYFNHVCTPIFEWEIPFLVRGCFWWPEYSGHSLNPVKKEIGLNSFVNHWAKVTQPKRPFRPPHLQEYRQWVHMNAFAGETSDSVIISTWFRYSLMLHMSKLACQKLQYHFFLTKPFPLSLHQILLPQEKIYCRPQIHIHSFYTFQAPSLLPIPI